jgi:glycosyltransferase involved in cell wall biosynthesis
VKVLVVDPSLFTLPYDRAFCSALAAAGAEVTLVGRPLRALEAIEPRGFAFLPLFYRRSEGSARRGILKGLEHAAGLLSLARLIDRVRPDIVHVQWLALPLLDRLLLAATDTKTRLVMTAHNSGSVHMARSRLQNLGLRGALSRFAAIVVHTEKTLAWLRGQDIPSDRILLLPHPPLDLPAADHRETVALAAPGTVTILFWGAIKPYKGLDLLVRAVLDHLPPEANLRVVIAGRPFFDLAPLLAEIEASPWRDRFLFDLGFLPEAHLAARIAAADIVVFPYREIDGSGALAATARFGKAIVATAVGAFAEPPARDCLELVPPGDPVALAERLRALIELPARRRKAAARVARLAELLPSWERFAAACLACYEAVSGRSPSGFGTDLGSGPTRPAPLSSRRHTRQPERS